MAYRSFGRFWQASTPATIRRLLKPHHPSSAIALGRFCSNAVADADGFASGRSAGLRGGDGGMRHVASLGSGGATTRPRSAACAGGLLKPFVKRRKNHRADAEAIAEAASRPTMRFVAVKRAWRPKAARWRSGRTNAWSGSARSSSMRSGCQPALKRDPLSAPKKGSDSLSVHLCGHHAAPSSRALRRSSFARPYIWRLTSLSLVMCRSVCPLDHGSDRAAATAG